MNTVFLSLGSNIEPWQHLAAAVQRLASLGSLIAVSPVYESLPVGDSAQPNYLNLAVLMTTDLATAQLKQKLLVIEQALGRARSANPNAPRTIDIDIALFNHEVLLVGKRRIPDPDVLSQPFVACPLADLAPDYVHPETGQTLAAIAARLSAHIDIWRRDDVRLETVK